MAGYIGASTRSTRDIDLIDRATFRRGTMKHVPVITDYVKPLGPYSHAVVANGFIFISAQTGLKPGGHPSDFSGPKVQDQTRQALRNVETIMKDLGGTLADVVKVTVYLANPSDFRPMNEAYAEFFPSEPPARSVARLGADVTGLLVTIEAIAVYSPHSEE
jgi:2-iminobutanoate/2-iminopropanoate deaminase